MTNDDERHYTTYLHAAAPEVWSILTSDDSHADWYMPCLEWDLCEGGAVSWGSGGQVFVRGTVVAVRPDAFFLAHTFAFPFLPEPAGQVRWRATQMGEVTQLWLRHELANRPQTAGIVGGSWPVMLARLKTLVESGKTMPEPVWPAQEGWDSDPV